jgi:hypothetical protein
MPYRFEIQDRDFSDYSAGRVFYGLPGYPAFPVRLAGEIFQRCRALRAAAGLVIPCSLYDPCCGGAYHLVTLGYLYRSAIATITGSDVDEGALALAGRNLALLTVEGLDGRIAELERLLAEYSKPSHAEALAAARRLRAELLAPGAPSSTLADTALFQADAADGPALRAGLAGRPVDLVITDVPYGRHTHWAGAAGDSGDGHAGASADVGRAADHGSPPAGGAEGEPAAPLVQMLEALLAVISRDTLVAVAADKAQKIAHPAYRSVERFQIGKRQVAVLRALR